ncbi:UNVERIFIED_CONTAM: gcl, partial [Trichonephila clavipes]
YRAYGLVRPVLPVPRRVVDVLEIVDEETHLGRQITLLRIDRLDVVGRDLVIVQHRHQLASLELRLDLPGRTPADAQPLLDPVVEQLAVIAVEVARHLHRHLTPFAQEGPATLLTALQVERHAVVPRQILEGARHAMQLEVAGCTADHAAIGEQLHRDVVGVGDLADADAHVVALAHQVDQAVGEVEGQLQVRVAQQEGRRMRRNVPPAERRRGGYHQVPAHRLAAAGHAGVSFIEVLEQAACTVEVLLAEVGQLQAARGAVHQLDAEMALQGIQAPPHHHGGHAFAERGGGKAAVVGDQHETTDKGMAVHSILQISTELKYPTIPSFRYSRHPCSQEEKPPTRRTMVMARMRAIEAAVLVMRREGVDTAFGVPGAAINPLYAALKKLGGIDHVLARHVEGASHMAEGYTRTNAGNIGVCIGTSGPAGTDMVTGLYSASADSIPILCITGQAPRARMHKEDFQAVDITSIVGPVTKWATTVMEPGQVPRAFQRAFQEMRSGRPGPVLIDLPFDVQMAEIEFDIDAYEPLPVAKPSTTRVQAEKAIAMLNEAERPLLVAGGGIFNADAADKLVEFAELTGVPVVPTLMGWGAIPDDHRLMVGMVGLQTSHRYGNATLLASDLVFGIGNRWANRHTGSVEVYTEGRKFIHVDIEPTQIGRVFNPDLGIVSDAGKALDAFLEVAREWKAAGKLKDRSAWVDSCRERKRTLQRKTHFDNVPAKPQRVYEEMNDAFGKDTCYVSTIGLSQIAGAQFLH